MMVIISLGYIWVGRKRSRCPAASKEWCQFGANCCQKSSTEQNSSSILIAEPPEDKHWFSSLLYLIRYGSLSRTHVNHRQECHRCAFPCGVQKQTNQPRLPSNSSPWLDPQRGGVHRLARFYNRSNNGSCESKQV